MSTIQFIEITDDTKGRATAIRDTLKQRPGVEVFDKRLRQQRWEIIVLDPSIDHESEGKNWVASLLDETDREWRSFVKLL